MRVFVLGGGGREHAIAWKLAQSPAVSEVMTAPGNPGTAELGPTVPDLDVTDPDAVAAAAAGADLVVVGPEAPLAAGVADALVAAGVPTLGPGRAAARLESSKAFAKQMMERAGIPTASAGSFTTVAEALESVETLDPPYVVKADGLAAGKGVRVTDDLDAAREWVRHCLDGGFGAAGETVLIEEFLDGPELSVIALCDGSDLVVLEPARDYKRLGNGDTGPNTGGMGCYSPVDLPTDLVSAVRSDVLEPMVAAIAGAGTPYVGFLYAGLALTADGPKVIEFNCRLGDPETQVVLPRLETDFAELCAAAVAGDLAGATLDWSSNAAVDVVLAAPGYPDRPLTGTPIAGVAAAAAATGVEVFHAGTATGDGGLVTAGGRVLNVVGTGPTVATARERAYAAAGDIQFEGRQFRSDVAATTEEEGQ